MATGRARGADCLGSASLEFAYVCVKREPESRVSESYTFKREPESESGESESQSKSQSALYCMQLLHLVHYPDTDYCCDPAALK